MELELTPYYFLIAKQDGHMPFFWGGGLTIVFYSWASLNNKPTKKTDNFVVRPFVVFLDASLWIRSAEKARES
jgi:hypothetical protein